MSGKNEVLTFGSIDVRKEFPGGNGGTAAEVGEEENAAGT